MPTFGALRHIANINRHGRDAGAEAIAFSPDGTRAVTVGSGDGLFALPLLA